MDLIRKTLCIWVALLLVSCGGGSNSMGLQVKNQKRAEEIAQARLGAYCGLQNLDPNSFSKPKILSDARGWTFEFENAEPKNSVRILVDKNENIGLELLHPQNP